MKKFHPAFIGLLQTLGVAVYCLLLALLFRSQPFESGSEYLVITLVLGLLVLSAAVTGSLVFAYPVYLALNKDMKQALAVLGYTLLSLFVAIVLALIIILFV